MASKTPGRRTTRSSTGRGGGTPAVAEPAATAANGGKRRRSGGAEEKSGSTSNTTEEHAPDSSAPSDGPSGDGKSPPGAVMPGGEASAGGSGAAMEEESSTAGPAADAGNNDTPPGHGSGKDPNDADRSTAAVDDAPGQQSVPMETEPAQSNDTKVDDTAKKKTAGYPSREAAAAGIASSDAGVPPAEDVMDTSENDAGPPGTGGLTVPGSAPASGTADPGGVTDRANRLAGVRPGAHPPPDAAAAAAGEGGAGGTDMPSFSMTLAIGPEDAGRVLAASGRFSAEVGRLRGRTGGGGADAASGVGDGRKGPPEPSGGGNSANVAAEGKAAGSDPPGTDAPSDPPPPLHKLLVPAARSCPDPLVTSFLAMLEGRDASEAEVEASLLFFLEADKSAKLLAAFDVVGAPPGVGGGGGDGEQEKAGRARSVSLSGTKRAGRKPDEMDVDERKPPADPGDEATGDGPVVRLVDRRGLVILFRSFLTAISTCVHGGKDGGDDGTGGEDGPAEKSPPEGKAKEAPADESAPTDATAGDAKAGSTADGGVAGPSPSGGDWKRSDRTQREILEVATFAADSLAEFAARESEGGGEDGGGNDRPAEAKAADGPSSADGADPAGTSSGKPASGEESAVRVSFDTFGRWYNSGGFSLVPWLELLDLSKWDQPGPSSKRRRLGDGGADGNGTGDGAPPSGPKLLADATQRVPALMQPEAKSFGRMFGQVDDASRTVVSFDFSGSSGPDGPGGAAGADAGGPDATREPSFHIDITEENLVQLRNLVRRTGFANLHPGHVEGTLLRHCRCERIGTDIVYIINRKDFGKFIREIVPREASRQFDQDEQELFSTYFTNFFTCFASHVSGSGHLRGDEVNAKELMVGFAFMFAGNKSAKLAACFDMVDVHRAGYLDQGQVLAYLRSYLTMLAGVSLLSADKEVTTTIRKRLIAGSPDGRDAFAAVENGARWTLTHFVRALEAGSRDRTVGGFAGGPGGTDTTANAISFEDFARWYTEGGYSVAPWLELLDLQKFLSLIRETEAEVLFTFPLANGRSLIVLRDDALYIRSVVNGLGLASLDCEDVWRGLLADGGKSSRSAEVDATTFVNAMMKILRGSGKMSSGAGGGGGGGPPSSGDLDQNPPEETLKNFFLSFDLTLTSRVPLNQLMCGLVLLCGGKKSSKLVFAFGLFDDEAGTRRKRKASSGATSSMSRTDLFYFFRSFLIVMFSCCNQSLDLCADAVTRYITDTAKVVSDDVMKYWKEKVDRVTFEQFSEWYNEGGFETAPWLELLDLTKWVLLDPPRRPHDSPPSAPRPTSVLQQPIVPTPSRLKDAAVESAATSGPTPTADHDAIQALLSSPKPRSSPNGGFAADDALLDFDANLDFLGVVDEEPAAAVGNQAVQYDPDPVVPAAPLSHPPQQQPAQPEPSPLRVPPPNAPLKFHLLTHDEHRGYLIAIGADQIDLLNRIVTGTGLHSADASTICRFITVDAKSRRPTNLTRKSFKSAMKRIFAHTFKTLPTAVPDSTQAELSEFTDRIFLSFDRGKQQKVNAIELACGFTVLCSGRKSDKLEHLFEMLDQDKDSLVSRDDITKFLQSFLTVLTCVSSSLSYLDGTPCGTDSRAASKAAMAGAEWAASQVFHTLKPRRDKICFDDFADWYTRGGYQNIPWLELLDLKKWCSHR